MNMFYCILNLNNFVLQRLMKGDSPINMPSASIGGDLASWSTFTLYGMTIMLMIFTGVYYMAVEQEDIFRWKNRNDVIAPFGFYNLAYFIILLFDLILKEINGEKRSTSLLCGAFFIICIIIFFYLKNQNNNIKITNFIPIYFENKNAVMATYGFLIGFIYIGLEFFLFNEIHTAFIVFFILLDFVLTLAFISATKEQLWSLKDYIFYLTDQKCYSAKLESIKEGFLVLHDVELYNNEIAERSIDKLKPESFEVEAIRNTNNQKAIIPSKMIIPKEQVLAMYILESENTRKNTWEKKYQVIAIIFILLLIAVIWIETRLNL